MCLRLAGLMAPGHSLARAHSWGGLNRVILERPVTGALVDLDALPPHPLPEKTLGELRHRFPNLSLVLLVRGERDPFALFRLGKAGIENLVLLSVEDLRYQLARTLARAGEDSATSMILRALSPMLPRREVEVIRFAMDSVHRMWSAEELAQEIGLTRPYLSERLKAVGLPSLGHFLIWSRLFHAGHWLEEPGRTGESVGRQLEYSSGAAFRRALKLYTGATPTEVRERGGLRLVFRRFSQEHRLRGRGVLCA